MADAGKVLGGAGMGAAAGAPLGPWGMAGGAVIGGLTSLLGGGDDNTAPAPPPVQYGGNELTNQLAALQYSEGLQQQQAQNAREAALYGNANSNFDIANAAQLRGAQQIAANPADQQRQLAALSATNAGIGRLNSTGDLLTDKGTAAMGPSVAEAQLRLGQSDAINQQLAMARSGRSLGSGQAAMGQAAFNNAMINQTTNQQAAAARLQEQQNYNQMQLAALQGAGNAYGSAGALAGQAGNQATTVRAGNEGLQAQNAALGQSQQQINNQTSGIYSQLGAQQQQLGMQANAQGQNAYQFGANQASNALGAQANADTGRLSSTTTTNIANQNNANAHDAANLNMAAAGFGAAANAVSNAGDSAPVNANNPSGSTSPYQGITVSSNTAGQLNKDQYRSSDENQKKNIRPITLTSPTTDTKNAAAATPPAEPFWKGVGKSMSAPADPGIPEGSYATPSYAQVLGALNSGYRASQFAPADVLNRVPGAGPGPSAMQSAVMARMQQAPGKLTGASAPPLSVADANASILGNLTRAPASTPMSSAATSMLGHSATASPIRSIGAQASPFMPAASAAPPAWGDVFNAPQFDPAIAAYLAGQPIQPIQHAASSGAPVSPGSTRDGETGYIGDANYDLNRLGGQRSSDVHSKTRIRELETQLAALSADAPPTASFAPAPPDTAALDDAYARQQQAPAVDLRPARGYSYEYKDPHAPGAAPGRHVGPMAQDLEHSAAAGTVRDTPHGKVVDTEGLTMVNTAALSEQQRKTEELERQLAALQGSGLGPMPAHDPSLYARPGAF